MKVGKLEWTDGTKMSYSGWILGQESAPSSQTGSLCLALQWKTSTSAMLPSNLYWTYQKCGNVGGFVCKNSRVNNVLVQNQTTTEPEGRITSPNYPNHYVPNINYWFRIITQAKSRIIVQFQKLDIEQQNECLYDYVSVQDAETFNNFHSTSIEKSLLKGSDAMSVDYRNDERDAIYKDQKITLMMNKQQSKRDLKNFSLNDSLPSFQTYIRLCGTHEGDMSKFDFVSKSNEVLLNFYSDYSNVGEGFAAVWRSIDISACPGQTLTSRDGVLMSPNFPHFLLHNLNCTYVIQAPEKRKVWIDFNSFDIGTDAEVLIDLGDGVLFQPLRDTSNIADGVFTSRNDKLKILLRTGSRPKGKGFKVTYRTSKFRTINH